MTNPTPITSIAALATAATLSAAVAAGFISQNSGLLSLIPSGAVEPDAIGRELSLHLSAFTAWATTILLIPAYTAVWLRNRFVRAWAIWRAFWAASFVAYIFHLAVSMFGFYGGDFAWMTNSSRVSVFWLGMALALWWPLDLWLTRGKGTRAMAIQRVALHVVTLVLFVGGSAVMGELTMIRFIGIALLAATVTGAVQFARGRGA